MQQNFFQDSDNQKKTPDNQQMHQLSNQQTQQQLNQQNLQQQLQQQMNHMNQMNQQHQQQQQQQQQQSGMANYHGTGSVASGNIVVSLTELPEPPIPVSEIGPIPPPPMFSTPSPTMIAGRPHGRDMNSDYNYDGNPLVNCIRQLNNELFIDPDEDPDDYDSDEDYPYIPQPNPNIDTSRIDEIPAKEPKFNLVPLKSALKKKPNTSNPGTPTQESNRALLERQPNTSFK
jgi:hypothetical protein